MADEFGTRRPLADITNKSTPRYVYEDAARVQAYREWLEAYMRWSWECYEIWREHWLAQQEEMLSRAIRLGPEEFMKFMEQWEEANGQHAWATGE